MSKNTRYQRLIQILKSPAAIVLGISLFLLAVNIVVVGKARPFNSDDLYWQQVVRTWTPFSGDTFYFGTKDIFVEQGPFFALMESVFPPSRKLLIAEAYILTAAAFVFCYLTSIYFYKKLKLKLSYYNLVPFVWLASFGYPIVQNYLNSSWRTFEVGISFLTFALVAAICFGDFKPLGSTRSKILSVLAAAFIGVVIYSDPYYLFFTVGPLALFAIVLYLLKKIDNRQLAIIIGGTVLAMIFAKASSFISHKAGVVIPYETPSVFINFDNILTNIVSSLHGLLIVYGADFFGRQVFKLATFGAAINAAILGFILYKAYAIRHGLRQPAVRRLSLPQLWLAFFAGVLAIVFLIYTSSSLVSVNNYRFFIIFIYCSVTLAVAMLAMSKHALTKFIISALFIGATIFNMYTVVVAKDTLRQPEVVGNVGNALNYDIINTVKSTGVQKGYASYWQGNVNTYLADGAATFLPSLCENGETLQFRWLIDGGQFDLPAQKTFYLIDPDIPVPPICTEDQLIVQFGEPEKVVKVHNKRILIFDYDITSKMR